MLRFLLYYYHTGLSARRKYTKSV